MVMRRDGSNRWARNNNWQFNKRTFSILQPATWRIWAALNLHSNFVCLPRLENIVYRWVIGVPFQTVSNIH